MTGKARKCFLFFFFKAFFFLELGCFSSANCKVRGDPALAAEMALKWWCRHCSCRTTLVREQINIKQSRKMLETAIKEEADNQALGEKW